MAGKRQQVLSVSAKYYYNYGTKKALSIFRQFLHRRQCVQSTFKQANNSMRYKVFIALSLFFVLFASRLCVLFFFCSFASRLARFPSPPL